MTHPQLRDLLFSVSRHPAFQELLHRLQQESRPAVDVGGLTPTAQALVLVLLWELCARPLLVVVDGQTRAEAMSESLGAFFDLLESSSAASRPQLLPAWDVLPNQGLSPHPDISQQRAVALWRMASGNASITVAPAAAVLARYEEPDFYCQLALTLSVGEEVPFGEVVAHLESVGYQRHDPVEMPGEYCVRGGILDAFSPESGRPVRIEFFGDLIESIRLFEPSTQRSVLKTDQCRLLPMTECPRTAALQQEVQRRLGEAARAEENWPGWEFALAQLRPRRSNLLSLTHRPVVVLVEPDRVGEACRRLWARLEESPREPCPPETVFQRWEELESHLAATPQVRISELLLEQAAGALEIRTRPSIAFGGNIWVAVAELKNLIEGGIRTVFFAPTKGELERLADIFREYGVPFQVGSEAEGSQTLAGAGWHSGPVVSTFLVRGRVRRGTIFSDPPLAIIGSEDLFETPEVVARAPRSRSLGAFSADIADLKPGDYVVHAQHGIGRYLGLRELTQDGQQSEYLLLEYADGARLYVPVSRLDLVHKFRGSGQATPALDKLGGVTWERTKKRIKAKMRDMAEELLKLYAERKLAQGFRYSPDSAWQKEFEDAFEYTETEDQLNAIRDVKRDMESDYPMDRLLCGDVGFGKTEVAMRAAFKALMDGRQVAVLAPTTVLAFQHYETFKRRFAAFPVRIEMLSRLVPEKQRHEILEDLAEGKVDIVIGTHRLLSKDVQFKDLGLLVIDEEQRFGVAHKERLKQLKKNVDVLTMTATPIPRTLHMALAGLRDMSVIETPPKDRLAIHTVVARYDPALIRAAIEQELGRGGQVYFIHNRVETIYSRAAELQQLVPQCRIVVGHGQMRENELERVMLGFMRHEYDLLLATTIVENGLDIPLANTIIIENAHTYGLAELYQLRGRVGRSNRRAYAYLLVPEDVELSETARKRLAALKEFSELGSGFKIAALDLELRGAGNLLGAEQHGHINAVGYETYVKLLEQTIQELRGQPAPLEVRTAMSLGLDLRIPPDYIQEETQRLRVYRKLAEASNDEQAKQVLEELADCYGEPPEPVRQLAELAVVKSLAERIGVEAIERRQGWLNLKFHPEARVRPEKLLELVQRTRGAQFTPAGVLRLPVDGGGSRELIERLRRCLEEVRAD